MTSATALSSQFWQRFAEAVVDFTVAWRDGASQDEDYYRIEGNLEALCDVAERLFDLPHGNLGSLFGLQAMAVCCRCGHGGCISEPRGWWVHLREADHPFEVIGELPSGSPFFEVLAVALLDDESLLERWRLQGAAFREEAQKWPAWGTGWHEKSELGA